MAKRTSAAAGIPHTKAPAIPPPREESAVSDQGTAPRENALPNLKAHSDGVVPGSWLYYARLHLAHLEKFDLVLLNSQLKAGGLAKYLAEVGAHAERETERLLKAGGHPTAIDVDVRERIAEPSASQEAPKPPVPQIRAILDLVAKFKASPEGRQFVEGGLQKK